MFSKCLRNPPPPPPPCFDLQHSAPLWCNTGAELIKGEGGHGLPFVPMPPPGMPMISFDHFTHITDIDEKEKQALYCKQLEAKLNFMTAELSEVQQKLNVEQKLSGQYRAVRDQYEEDLGEVRKELADLRKEHCTCKTFWIVPRHNVTLLQKPLGGGAWGMLLRVSSGVSRWLSSVCMRLSSPNAQLSECTGRSVQWPKCATPTLCGS